MRNGTNDKELIGDQSFRTHQNLEALTALIRLALFQAEHSSAIEFAQLRGEWRTLLGLMKEKAESAAEANAEIDFLASTFVPAEETLQ